MTTIVLDRDRTDVHTDDEEDLFVAQPYHDARVVQYVERVRGGLGNQSENGTKYLAPSFGCISTFERSVHHETRSRTEPRFPAEGRMTLVLEPSSTRGSHRER